MQTDAEKLQQAIAALSHNYDPLGNLIRPVVHTVKVADKNVEIRAHYLPFRNGKPMVGELLDAVRVYICNFALSRSEIDAVHEAVKTLPPQESMLAYNKLRDAAADLFIKAQKSTNRNGECGELLLYLLIEWKLAAPQIMAKMSLKTNGQMPVHGSDGIHIKYDETSDNLIFIWGEAKLHKTIGGAIKSALQSVGEALKYEKQKEDINLVRRYFDLSGLPASTKDKVLDYLNPLHASYHKRADLSACLIGFDFEGFRKLASVAAGDLEDTFQKLVVGELSAATAHIEQELAKNGISHHRMEMFFIPFESVDELRKAFQNRIGWKS
jgi:hypothetical protein